MSIPEQVKGKQSDNAASCTAVDEQTAEMVFNTAVDRLLDVNNWKNFSGFESATFQLCDDEGRTVDKVAEPGDHIRIDIPGPGTKAGQGFDWVKVVKVDVPVSNQQTMQMTVSPCANPIVRGEDTAHFFETGASSTFVISRHGNEVTASVHGRNEKANKDTGKMLDNVRNRLVAGGAFGGLADIQWSNLAEGLLQDPGRAR